MPSFTDFNTIGAPHLAGTLFDRMRRFDNRNTSGIEFEAPDVTVAREGHRRDLAIVDVAASEGAGVVRFERADIDGQPGIAMQERKADGRWHEIWSLPSQSPDAREGMFGWLMTQSHRWQRFARMAHRRGGDELTAWIIELMVQPSAHAARAPRFVAGHSAVIDQAQRDVPRFQRSARVDTCLCQSDPRGF